LLQDAAWNSDGRRLPRALRNSPLINSWQFGILRMDQRCSLASVFQAPPKLDVVTS
jgi:hypothetical protein